MLSQDVGILARSRIGGLRGQMAGSAIRAIFAGAVIPSFNATPWVSAVIAASVMVPSTCAQ